MDSDDETGSNVSMAQWQAADIDHFIRHVTVRQLLEADQMHSTAPFKIEGKEFKRFILVANICYLDECETYRDIGLDDGTGRIKAREWNDNQEIKSNSASIQVINFPYVRVIGELEQFRNRNMIKVMGIEAVFSVHEPYYHVLHAVHDTLVHERGPPPAHISRTTLRGVPEIEDSNREYGQSSNHTIPPSSDPQHIFLKSAPVSHAFDPDHHEGRRSTGKDNSSHKKGALKLHASPRRSNTQIQRLTEHTASLSLGSPHLSSSLVTSSASSQQPRRSSRKHDPYSSLTALERDIILCMKTAATQYAKESMYPSVGPSQRRGAIWKGLQFSVIVRAISSQHPALSSEELHDAFEHLLDESYVFSPVDDEHFDCI